MDALLRRYGCVHNSLHGDGRDVLGRIVVTCEQMLRDRGCTRVVRADDPFEAILASRPTVCGRGGPRDLDVYVHAEDKVGVKWARTVLEHGVAVVAVAPEGATPFTKKECEGKPIQFMTAREACVNVTRHALVPRHEVVEDATHTLRLLPKIADTDPVVRWYDWPPGTVVRVFRCFGGHEPVPYLRVVGSGGA